MMKIENSLNLWMQWDMTTIMDIMTITVDMITIMTIMISMVHQEVLDPLKIIIEMMINTKFSKQLMAITRRSWVNLCHKKKELTKQ